MVNFKCRYCKSRLTAYIQGELAPKSRRRIARHLDECSSCYMEYVRQRDLSDQLAVRVPVIGQPKAPQLQKIWAGIQADMQPPKRTARRRYPYQARYGLVALAMVLVLLVPLILGNRNVPFSVPSQPAPPTAVTQAPRSSASESPMTVALVLTDDHDQPSHVALRNTPEARAAH
jgi:anti-sigma factor RsiW